MRIAAMVLGILGGLIGAYLVTFSPWEVPAWILLTWTLLLPVVAIAGGVLALRRPAVGGILMLVSGIAGVIAAHLYWLHPGYWLGYIFAGFLLIMGGAIALAAREKRPAARVAVMALGILGGLFGAYGAYIAMPWVPLLSAAIVFFFPHRNCRRSTSSEETGGGRDIDAHTLDRFLFGGSFWAISRDGGSALQFSLYYC
ncbi:hypothetical protein M1O16_05020 [Dehalococcoidia bacterium]|nr:hypothetical protein [Dehalococcoidia bacterium]